MFLRFAKTRINAFLSLLMSVLLLLSCFVGCGSPEGKKEAFREELATSPDYSKLKNNSLKIYELQQMEAAGLISYVHYYDFLYDLHERGVIDEATYKEAMNLGITADKDNETAATFVKEFTDVHKALGYTVERLDGLVRKNKYLNGGRPQLYAYKDN